MPNWKIGDVVRVKSGGPKMTVYELRNDGLVGCIWFSEDKKLYDAFKGEVLEDAAPKPIPTASSSTPWS